MKVATPWITSPKFDLATIIGPSVVVTAIVLVFGRQIMSLDAPPVWLWMLLVLGIDVAHVYSSLFRTYLDKEEFQKRRTLYIVVPALCWTIGIALYAISAKLFWIVLAYAAIYHFVRQQYGFLMLYRRGEPVGGWSYRIDQSAIYLATLYPLVYWHTYTRNFRWFDESEMLRNPFPWIERATLALYLAVLAAFAVKEILRSVQRHEVNAGKVLLLATTALSWSVGIVLYNGDLTFAMINIVSHGVPYIALVWAYQHKKRSRPEAEKRRYLKFFQLKFVPFYLGALFLLAYFEEGIWDWFVWHEHPLVFGQATWALPSATVLMVLVPLLTMPQATHYVLDAFIWRVNRKGKEEVRAVIG